MVLGGCWFFTVNLLDRRRRLLADHVDALREATRLTQDRVSQTPVSARYTGSAIGAGAALPRIRSEPFSAIAMVAA